MMRPDKIAWILEVAYEMSAADGDQATTGEVTSLLVEALITHVESTQDAKKTFQEIVALFTEKAARDS